MDDQTTRERVLEAAERLFYSRGIQAVTMDQLRADAGVPLKRMYAQFPSKESIVAEVLRRRQRSWTQRLTAAVAAVSDPQGRLLAVYDFLEQWFDEDDFRGCAFINSFGELGGTSPVVAELAREHKQAFFDYVGELVAQAGAPAALAPQLALLAEGAQSSAAILPDSHSAAHARRAAETLIAAALRPVAA